MSDPSQFPVCVINGEEAIPERLLPVATQNYGHITMLQLRNGMVRGLDHHLARLDAANRELFGRGVSADRVIGGLKAAAAGETGFDREGQRFRGRGSRECDGHSHAAGRTRLAARPLLARSLRTRHAAPQTRRQLWPVVAAEAGRRGRVRRSSVFDRHGEISEATIWNVGFFDRDAIVWPAADSLRGVTQIIIDEGLAAAGIEVRYEAVRAEALASYRAAFLSNSTTYGRLLSMIGDVEFEISASAGAIIHAAYERTPLLPLPS